MHIRFPVLSNFVYQIRTTVYGTVIKEAIVKEV